MWTSQTASVKSEMWQVADYIYIMTEEKFLMKLTIYLISPK